jgi:glycosyltransferase involved in cell wall biosynthesis
MSGERSGLRISHVQPIALDIYGHRDEDFGSKVKYFLPNMAAAQARLGHRPTVHLLTSFQRRELSVDGVDVVFHGCIQPPRSQPERVRFARQLSASMVRAIDADAADVVHFHGARSLHLMFTAVAWCARREGVPLVAQDHGPRQVGRVMRSGQRMALRSCKAVMAANEEGLERLGALGVPEDRLHLVPNAVDPAIFHPVPQESPPPDRPFRVFVLSRLWEDKDPLTMAAALGELARRGRRVEVTVVGRGPLREPVEVRLRGAGVAATFIEEVPQTAMPDHYRHADAFVLTSLREGSNQAVLEAMACGIPVVATDIPGVRESLRGVGVTVAAGDPTAVADSLERLASNPAHWRGQRQRGLRRTSGLTWQGVAERVCDIYESA